MHTRAPQVAPAEDSELEIKWARLQRGWIVKTKSFYSHLIMRRNCAKTRGFSEIINRAQWMLLYDAKIKTLSLN